MVMVRLIKESRGGKDKEKVNGALGGNEARVKEISKEGLGSSNCAGHGGSVSLGFFIGHVKLTSLGPKDRKNSGRDIIDRSGRKPSNALWGLENCFKSFRNSRSPLIESME
ncbi:hypothetical protein Gorai_021526 [Gossypium raimondii]|uniref:Uncharacterized protein n=1 Tax=Gossypium raimondii TaxID=29730 RepID=A0A7J8NQK1_GOSRA|nr:hypothetical protein [Gossypium raimondii]